MKHHARWQRTIGFALPAIFLCATVLAPHHAIAQQETLGSLTGTVTDAGTGRPIADVRVTASAPSETRDAVTNAQGFYVINALTPDTYTVSFQAAGYAPMSEPGITISQQQVVTLNQRMTKELRTIASVQSRAASNLVRPSQGSDVYNVSGQQLAAATGATNRPETLYEYLGTVPGVTINGGVGTPRIRGGDVHDIGYEFDGIPIRERLFGIFTSNITNVGIGNIEVYTGGLPANDASSGTGIINSVVKTGTYPPFGTLSYITTAPDHNIYVNFEYGGQTPNRKFSYYVAGGTTDSSNDYNYGAFTYPDLLYGGYDGAGPVKERDFVGNFHWKPDAKNDFQFLIQNGIGDFIFNYLLQNPQPKLTWDPCPGAALDPTGTSYTGAIGGTAANGQPCPIGIQFGLAANQTANIWHHYSGIGKIQWNHIINQNSFLALRIAENYNMYAFSQPLEDPNNPATQNPGGAYNIDPTCPLYPYSPGTPVQVVGGNIGLPCSWDIQSFYGDRSSHMYLGAVDYTNIVNQNLTLNFGAGQEYDKNLLSYYLRDFFNGDGTWPDNYAYSDMPTHFPYAYGTATLKINKWTLIPGLRWARAYYGIPLAGGGPKNVGGTIPTFSGTYQFGANDVLRFSYGLSEDFIGSAYIYRSFPHAAGGPAPNPSYDPATNGSSFNPELNRSADLMWEHQFGRNTSIRFGPWYNNAIGYYEQFNALKGYTPSGAPIYSKQTYFTNSGRHHALGLELAVSHTDPNPVGLSWWLTGTLDNYWTTSPSGPTSVSPLVRPIPTYFTSRGILVRSSDNPMFSGTIYADARFNRVDLYPEIYYQTGTFYNIGYSCPPPGGGASDCATYKPVLLPTYQAAAYWYGNFTVTYKINGFGTNILALRVRNLFDTERGTTPCPNSASGTGCYPFDGPQSGFFGPPGAYVYQNVTTDPRRIEFSFTHSF